MAAAITSISGSIPWGTIQLTDKNTTYDVSNYSMCMIVDENLSPENIRTGVTILGITGTGGINTADATAVAGSIKKGKTAWVNGSLITGTAQVTVSGTTVIFPN